MDQLVRCTNCVTPETHETIVFDEKGVLWEYVIKLITNIII